VLSETSVVFILPESVLAKLVSLPAALANDGSEGDSIIRLGIVPFGSFCCDFFCKSFLLDGLKALSRFLFIKLGVLLNGTSAKSKLGCVIAIAGVRLTFERPIGDILLDIVGCLVIGKVTFGTTAGGDKDCLVCWAELELEVSNLFLGEVGD
jgi:hypothetical protein